MQPEQNNNQPVDSYNQESMPTETYSVEESQDQAGPADTSEQLQAAADDMAAHWSAQEYVTNPKKPIWYVWFGLAVAVLVVLDIIFFKDYIFSALLVVIVVAVVLLDKRPPAIIDYTLSPNQGLYIQEKLYHFSEFKAFGVAKDGEHHSIILIPVKRFSPSVTVYFPEEQGEKIVDLLGSRLPMEEVKQDLIDKIIRKIRL